MEALEDELADDYMKKVEEASRNIDGMEGGDVTLELWKLKKQLCPQNTETPTAMLDEEENLVTNENEIKQLAINAYKERPYAVFLAEVMFKVFHKQHQLSS